jgi:hypothetical protein
MADETINLNLRADLTQLRSELGKIPGITETEAKKMVKALSSQLKKAEGASKQAAAAMKRANAQAFQDIKQGAEKVFGGVVGDIADVSKALKAIGPAGMAAGAALVGIGVAAVGAYKTVDAMYDLALGLRDANKELNDLYLMGLPGFTQASQESLDASERLNAQMKAFGSVAAQVRVELGERLAPELESTTGDLLQIAIAALDTSDKVGGLADGFIDLEGETGKYLDRLVGLGPAFALLAMATEDYSKEVDVLSDRAAILAQVQEVNTKLQAKAKQVTVDAAQADRDRADAIRDAAAALREKQAIEQESILADQKLFLLAEEGEEQYRREEAAAAAAAAEAAALAAQERIDLGKMISAAKEQQLAIDARNDDAYFDGLADKIDKQRANAQATYAFLGGAAQDFLATQIAAAEDGTKAQKKAGMAAFVAQKALTTSQIIVDGIRAVSVAMASAPPPANFALAGVVGAAYAGLAVQNAAAPPPKFHTGGEVSATLLDGEHVMDRRASRNNREALEEMNRTGQLPSGGESRSYVVIGDRMADDITTRGIRGPKSAQALRTSGRTGRTRTYR